MPGRLQRMLFQPMAKVCAILTASCLLTLAFHAVEVEYLYNLFHDLRMTFDPRPFRSQDFRVSELPAHGIYYTADELERIITDLEKADPRLIVWTPSSVRLPPDPREQRRVYDFLVARPRVYLATREGVRANWQKGYKDHAVFRNFPRQIEFGIVVAPDQRLRRVMLHFKRTGALENSVRMMDLFGFPFDAAKFDHHYDFMNTTQIYLKYYGRAAFGDHAPDEIAASAELREDYRDKIVFVGDRDEEGTPVDAIYRSLFSTEKNARGSGYWVSLAHPLATFAENFARVDYIRLPPDWANWLFSFLAISLFLGLLTFASATTAAVYSVPVILVMLISGWLIYLGTDFFVELTRPFLGMLVCQYLGLPYLLIKYIRERDAEAAKRAREEEARTLKGRVVAKSARADLGLKIALQVAHDIRSPLSAINSVAFAARDVLPERGRELLRDSVNRINGVANELLERYRGGLVRQDDISDLTELGQLTRSITEGFRETWPRIDFVVDVPPEPVFAPAPKSTLERGLANLIGNAIEALLAGGGGRIETRVMVTDANYLIDVIDDGPGIAPELLPMLFTEGATHGKVGGTGLGLYQTREALRKIGGDLQHFGSVRGAWFQLRIPRAAQALELKVDRKVVLAEDAEDARAAWTRMLKHAGAEVQAFADPESALAAIETLRAANSSFTLITDLIFQGSELTGFDIAAAAADCMTKVLCTSLAESEEIRTLAREQGLRVLPKTALARAQITLAEAKSARS